MTMIGWCENGGISCANGNGRAGNKELEREKSNAASSKK
jgi:hypothetical protein